MGESFDCTACEESLFGQKYILKEEEPHCIRCFEALFCSTCEACQTLISCTSKVSFTPAEREPETSPCQSSSLTSGSSPVLQDLSYQDRHWHSQCFLCATCRRPLVDRPFTSRDADLMCTECYSNQFSARCRACLKTIMPGEKEGRQFDQNLQETISASVVLLLLPTRLEEDGAPGQQLARELLHLLLLPAAPRPQQLREEGGREPLPALLPADLLPAVRPLPEGTASAGVS